MNHTVPHAPLRVIVNGDDLGIDHHVNETLFHLMEKGRLTSATLMISTPAAEEAMQHLRAFPHVSFGVHLNLTYHWPLTQQAALRPLLNEEGYLCEQAHHVPYTDALKEAVYQEWSAQIKRALQSGVPVSHLDSHHHVHTKPDLWVVLRRIQKAFGIHKVRGSWSEFPNLAAPLPTNLSSPGNTPPSMISTRAFCSLHTFLAHHGNHRTRPHTDLWELMTHPGCPGDQDTALLETPWEERINAPIRLISFHDL